MQVGVTHYVQNQTMGSNLQALQGGEKVDAAANMPTDQSEWLDDQVFWSDRLYELFTLAERVRLREIGYLEMAELRQMLFESGWITPAQAKAITDISKGLSDRLRYQASDVINNAMQDGSGQMKKELSPVLTMVENLSAVQEQQKSAA
ncbi:hypothetical protein ACFOSD_14655 [Salinispirillum marinum]|uniref:Uncharacterized protein n=2 Tax=Saccharospirillaceae TaxID=255527 RepID=A0ABV8BGW8_9GAMM